MPEFVTSATIISSLEVYEKSSSDYATSVKQLRNWIFRQDGTPLNDINYKNLSTKEIKPLWQSAHCFHIFNKKQFFADGFMLRPGHLLLPVPEQETIDVDTYEDYEFVRWKHEICN